MTSCVYGKKHALKIVDFQFQILQNLLLLAVIVFVVIFAEFLKIVLIIFTSLPISITLFRRDITRTCFLQIFNFF